MQDDEDDSAPDSMVEDVEISRLPTLAAAGMAWSAVRQWGGRILSLAVVVALARVLSPDDFGLVGLAAVFIGFLDVPLRVSLGDALIQREKLRDLELDSAFWGLLGVSGALALALAAASPLLGSLSDNPDVVPLIAALALGLPLTGTSVVPEAVLRRQMKFRALTVRKLVADGLAGAIAVGLALGGAGVWALVAKSLIQSVLLTGLAVAAVSWRPRLRFSWPALRDIAVFGFWSVSNSVVSFAYRNVDNLIIGAMLGATALGYYVVAFQILTIAVLLVTDTIEATALSAFSRLQSDRGRIGRGVTVTMRANAVVVTAIAALTVALAPSITVLFGDQWLPAADLVRILILGSLIAPIASIAVTVMKSIGRPDLTFKIAIPNVVGLALVMALTTPLGLYWVSSARILLLAVFVPVNLWILHRYCDVDRRAVGGTFARVTVLGVAAGAVAVAVVGTWEEPASSPIRFVLAAGAGGLVYLAGVAVLGRSEIALLRGFVRSRRARSTPAGPGPSPTPVDTTTTVPAEAAGASRPGRTSTETPR